MPAHRQTPAFRRTLLAHAVLASLLAAPLAHADTTTDLGSVQAGSDSAQTSAAREATKQSAPAQALTKAPLAARQPESVISQQVIENNASAASNYTDIMAVAPSVMSIDPNGPGLAESGANAAAGPTIRGFSDGQYNVTFDGIPWGDSNDFTHHSTAYFMAQDLGPMTIQRGPGDASNIGPATFGGTVQVTSKDPLDVPQASIYGTIGSWNTHMLGAEFDTGTMKNYGDTRAMFDYRHLTSDGALSNAGFRRSNLFLKVERPVGDESLLTLVAMKNDTQQHNPIGATSYPYVNSTTGGTSAAPGQMQAFGSNYAYNTNPLSQANSAYNYDNISTDFEYIDLKTILGSWNVDNKLYTYAYYHDGYGGATPNDQACAYGTLDCVGGVSDGTVPASIASSAGTNNADGTVNLYRMYMNYRSIGDLFKGDTQLGNGTLKAGAWVDHQYNGRYETSSYAGNGVYNSDRLMTDTLDQFQPYVEYTWNATPDLKVTPGLKYSYFHRGLNATINQSHGANGVFGQTWSKVLPSIDVHYMVQPGWAVYGQAAEGFLAPNINVFYNTNPNQAASLAEPQQTQNYQLGTAWTSHQFTASADVYRVNDSNAVTKVTYKGTTPVFSYGKSHFQGVEVEGDYAFGGGFSVYANASYNQAIDDNTAHLNVGQQLAGIPKTTEALGLIYNRGAWYGSLVTKFIGSRNGDFNGATPVYPFAAVSLTNLAINYTAQGDNVLPKGTKIGVQVDNLFDTSKLYALAGYTGSSSTPLFYDTAPRSVMLNFSYPFN